MRQLVIIGAGGFGREVLDWARQSAAHGCDWMVKGFLDDNPRALDGFASEVPLLGSIAAHRPAADEVFVCALGNVAAKRRCVAAILERGGAFVRVIHRTAVVSPSAVLGEGVILCPGSIVTARARLGDFVGVNLHSTVAHDAVVGDWCQLHCHVDITGGVVLGEGVLVGSHASIQPGVRVGAGAIVGVGAIVTRDVPPGATVYGPPARILEKNSVEGAKHG
jgi:sugar O-acyltransferase (sialic acid O-acetyltransferase NeuD family)